MKILMAWQVFAEFSTIKFHKKASSVVLKLWLLYAQAQQTMFSTHTLL